MADDDRLVARVAALLREAGLVRAGDTVVVACSGGPDSLALLDIMRQLAPHFRLRIVAAHYEHGIRGAASQADADFVAEFARRQVPPVPCVVGHGDVPAAAAQQGISVEAAARQMRYDFLERVRTEHDARSIAVAHHEDDQAETVLMRLLRGTGVDGLAAMRPRGTSPAGSTVIRPLLTSTRADIEAYCASHALQPRHDATNDIPDCTRNRLRLQLLPQLRREYNPELTPALARLAALAADDSDYIAAQAASVYEQCIGRGTRPALNQAMLAQQPPALERVVLRRFCREVLGSPRDVDFAAIERLRHLVHDGHTGSSEQLLRGYTAEISYGWLYIYTPGPAAVSAGSVQLDPQPGTWEMSGWQFKQDVLTELPEHTPPLELYYSPSELPGPLILRTRQPGDYIELAGGCKKIKKLFIDSRLPRAQRDSYPLLACGPEVIWVPGYRRSKRCRASGEIRFLIRARAPQGEPEAE